MGLQKDDRSGPGEVFDEAGSPRAGDDARTFDASHGAALKEAHPAVAQPLVGKLIDADLSVRPGIAHLKTNDLPRGRVGSQGGRRVNVQAPLAHSEKVDAPHVGQARAESGQPDEQRPQVFSGPLQDDIHGEVASGRRRGGLGRPRVTFGQVGQHRGEGLENPRVRAH